MSRRNTSLATLPWSTVDWSQTNLVIAAQFGCSHTTVGVYRRKFTQVQSKPAPRWNLITNWSAVSNATVAQMLGVSLTSAANHRRRHGLPYGPRSPGSGLRAGQEKKRLAPLTLRAKAKRLEAVWAWLWPDDPANSQQRDEVEELRMREYANSR